MSDHRVEAVARAIYNISPAIQPWDGDPFCFDESRAKYERERAYRQATAAIAALDGLT
jgi:hypothetical protein